MIDVTNHLMDEVSRCVKLIRIFYIEEARKAKRTQQSNLKVSKDV